MELQAAIEGLKALKEGCVVDIYTDSTYVRDGITKWLVGWKKNGWRTSANKPVKNQDLWQELETLAAQHSASWHWVRGHADNAHNNRADELAVLACKLGRG